MCIFIRNLETVTLGIILAMSNIVLTRNSSMSLLVLLHMQIHVPLALQEAAKSMPHEALVAGLVNAGAHPALAIAAVQSAAQSAKDAALKEFHQELQSATSAPLAALSKQSSMVLTRANSMLESAGSSLSGSSPQDALFHQAAQVLQRQVSGEHCQPLLVLML